MFISKKRYNILFVLLLIIAVSCGPSAEELTRQKFNRANVYFQNKQYNEAMLVLDSIVEEKVSEEFVVKSKTIIQKIKLSEQERNLVVLDSMLAIKELELKKLMKNFIVSEKYGSKSILIHKRQRPKNSYNRSYIRMHLDMDGNFYISSRYTGSKNIYHNKIKVYNKKNSQSSKEIAFDGFDNRRFDDNGTFWEVVNYKNGDDGGIIDYISQNVDKPLKAVFIGKKHYYIVLEKYDKEAIRDGYEISFVLKEIVKIKEDKKNIINTIKRIKNNM